MLPTAKSECYLIISWTIVVTEECLSSLVSSSFDIYSVNIQQSAFHFKLELQNALAVCLRVEWAHRCSRLHSQIRADLITIYFWLFQAKKLMEFHEVWAARPLLYRENQDYTPLADSSSLGSGKGRRSRRNSRQRPKVSSFNSHAWHAPFLLW